MTETVTDEKVVSFRYKLTNDAGEELDASGTEPLPYLHGAGNIVPGLEKEMTGKSVGASFAVTVPPEEGYGVRQGEPVPVERSAFPSDVELQVGLPFTVENQRGEYMTLWVTAVEDDKVMMDQNHPLAGETLHFDIEIVDVREATDEELAHGHPHGPGGHHHHGEDGHDHDHDGHDH